MNYTEALAYIHNTYKFGSKLGLENIKYLLDLLGNPQNELKVIHIAGTNGKGSTASFINSILIKAKYRVGLYTSPYLEIFTERIRINGENIPEDKLANITALVKSKIEEMVNQGKNHPTEFEVVTAIALYYYAKEEIDFLVLEVGLGGRLDATNVIDNPLVSVITSIDFDHMQFLGDTISKIAFEKAGIIKEHSHVVSYPQREEANKVIIDTCKKRRSSLFTFSVEDIRVHTQDIGGQKYSATILGKQFKNVSIQMLGAHQIYNSATALCVVEVLRNELGIRISENAIYDGLKETKWAGRMEVIKNNPLVVIDGAHNIQGVRALSNSIESLLKNYEITLLIGVLKDKEIDEFLEVLMLNVKRVIVTKPNNPRAMDVETLVSKISKYNKEVYACEYIEEATKKAIEITNNDEAIVCAGSLYMIGEVRKYLKN
ncbi:MAG: bifunctional folylpolyglutamate synthase/dihydrofolate synthase [Alkaliphilus sp.]|nr:MAG: bifunctional folylpolyglutamate synthase/dihydrofolate synthase [Alkaliphilus sp.]